MLNFSIKLRILGPFLLLGLLVVACSQKPMAPSPSTIYNWAEENLSQIPHTANADEWQTLLNIAMIPNDFPYRKSRNDFSNGKNPIFEIDSRNFETVKNTGILSSMADFCKKDYESLNFLPLMQWQRSQLPETSKNGYEIYILGVAHGYAMGKTDEWLEIHPINCTGFSKVMDGRFLSQVFGTKF
jgi:hypothetical protein